jgi:hypothetical protein
MCIMFWVTTTALFSACGLGMTLVSIAFWGRRLRGWKTFLASSRLFRETPWMTSDTGFLILSERLAEWSVMVLYGTTVWASLSALTSPERTIQCFRIVTGTVLLRSTWVAVWTHARSKEIHREPEDDGSGVYGMAEINWRKRCSLNTSLAGAMCAMFLWWILVDNI